MEEGKERHCVTRSDRCDVFEWFGKERRCILRSDRYFQVRREPGKSRLKETYFPRNKSQRE